jgi:hypothetical protein
MIRVLTWRVVAFRERGIGVAAGTEYQNSVITRLLPQQATQTLVAGVSGTRGYTAETAGTSTVILSRRYTPVWAIVLGVLTLPVFLIGLAFFFVKNSETLMVDVSTTELGTSVSASGIASADMAERLNNILDSLQNAS